MKAAAAAGRPNILFVMTDQQRFDTIAALGNSHIHTPNLDRLVRRGVSFVNGYSSCAVCVAARYTVRTGREPATTRIFSNARSAPVEGQPAGMEERCGRYLPRTMQRLGYRTFGIGKFHTQPSDEELGYDVHLHSEELYGTLEARRQDAYARWIHDRFPEYDWEHLMGERTEMYYIPQRSTQPAECTVERWAADRAVEQIQDAGEKPFFGFVSFVGPHPPFAPPFPFNHCYDPDRMPNPVCGDPATDHMDAFIPHMNHLIWADGINDHLARILKARYYGEITYIDDCLGLVLDAVDARADADNTLICFFADHGDHMGDHAAWQKETFFDACCRVPFLVSWPATLPADERREELVCLTDLFGMATRAAGAADLRDGHDVLGMLAGETPRRQNVIGYYGEPGTPQFKTMVRTDAWKYIDLANGGREQLFDVKADPDELVNRVAAEPAVLAELRATAEAACDVPGARDALDKKGLKAFPFAPFPSRRICQFDTSMGPSGFPERPGDLIRDWKSGKFASR